MLFVDHVTLRTHKENVFTRATLC